MSSEWSDPRLAKEYAEKQRRVDWYENEVNMPSLLSLLPKNTKSILDFGSGPGQFTDELAKKYVVEGADISLPLIEIASSTYPHLRFRQWDGQSPYSGDKKFDVIFSKLTIHFIKDLHKFAHYSHGILNSNGSLVLSIRHPINSTADVNGNYLQTATYLGGNKKYGLEVQMIHRSFEDYIRPFVENGFVLISLIEPKVTSKQAKKYKIAEKELYTPKRLNLHFMRVM